VFSKLETFGYSLCFISEPNYVIVCNDLLTDQTDVDIVVLLQNQFQETPQLNVYVTNSGLNRVDLYLMNAEKAEKVPLEPIKSLTDKSLGLGKKFCPTSLHVGFKTPEILYIGSSCLKVNSYIAQYWMSMDILMPGTNLFDLGLSTKFDFCDFNDQFLISP
jgi:hypothetical protein